MTAHAARLDIENLHLAYDRVPALRGIDLSLAPGEFVALLGPSGCGKTSLLRSIAGFVHPQRGRIVLAGADLLALPPRRRNIGMVFQSYALFPHMDAAGNVAFGLRCRGVEPAETRERVAAALSLVGLDGLADRKPRQLSGGQQQRVALARALVIEPSMLLLDEPLGALDRKLRIQMQTELKGLQRRLGVTTVFVTHDQEEAMAMADRIAVMRDGRIEQADTPDILFRRPATAWVAEFIGSGNLIAGRVEASEGTTRLVAHPALDVALAPGTAPPGTQALVFVRAERLRLKPAPEGPGLAVTGRRFLGVHMEIQAEPEAGGVRALVTPEAAEAFPIGARVRASAAAADSVVLEARSRFTQGNQQGDRPCR